MIHITLRPWSYVLGRANDRWSYQSRGRRGLDADEPSQGPWPATRFVDSIRQSPQFAIAHVDAIHEAEALDWLRSRDEREYSFVDATSFAFMRANGITEALAFDGDFAAAGFTELRP